MKQAKKRPSPNLSWLHKHFDTVEHAKMTISAGGALASVISLVLILTWLLTR